MCDRILFLGLLMLSLIEADLQAITITADDSGRVVLSIDGTDRVTASPTVYRALAGETGLSNRIVQTTFDPATNVLVKTTEWGAVTTTYQPVPHGLRMSVRLSNTTDTPITELNINLFRADSLGDNQRVSSPTWGVEGPPIVYGVGDSGSLVLIQENNDRKPLILDLNETRDAKTQSVSIAGRASLGGNRVILDDVTAAREIPAGGSETLTFVVLVGPTGSDPLKLAGDIIDAYRQANPMGLDWPDRRPIVRLYFGGGVSRDQALENLKNPDSVTPPPVDEAFRKRVLDRFKSCVAASKAVDAQGVIIWDLEGETFPHATTYIGDPRHIRLLNPQMDLVIDEGMQILKDAGLRAGVTLRPTSVRYLADKNTAGHVHSGVDPFEELDAKVAYAQQRWGCTIFYVDTNFFWRPYPPDNKWQSGQLTPELWRALQAKYPDTLFIPEFGNPNDFAYTAPYGEADMGLYGTPELVRAIWPQAWRVITIEDADPYHNFERFVNTVREGNALMSFAYGMTHYMVAMQRIYREASLRDAGVPQRVAQATASDLITLLGDSDVSVRHAAARRLIDEPNPGAVSALLARAVDTEEEWVVRHAAVVTLAGVPDASVVPALIELLVDRRQGLYAAATAALAGQGAPAVEPVLQQLESLAISPKANAQTVAALGDVLAELPAKDALPRIEILFAQVPAENREYYSIRRSLVATIGRLDNPAAEGFLLRAFEDEKLRGAAAPGLVLLDSQEGVAKITQAIEDARAAKKYDLADQLNRALKAK